MTDDRGSGSSDPRTEPFDDGVPRYGPPSYGANPYSGSPLGAERPRYGAPGMLASAADRDRALDVLQAAYGDGRLDKDEFDLRSAQVLASRHYGELAPIVADLPGGSAFGPPPAPAIYPRPGYYVATQVPTSNLAIGSLVCSLFGFFPPATIVAVILGHVARKQIRATRQRGDGLAVAGLVIGYIGLTFWALILIVAIVAAAHG
ncbi:MAG: DUF1707 and DUF4190 domain-containing protein [Trebonia sp.]